jgi:hypothetical protein
VSAKRSAAALRGARGADHTGQDCNRQRSNPAAPAQHSRRPDHYQLQRVAIQPRPAGADALLEFEEAAMIAYCDDCGATFRRDPDEGWKRLCLRCWIARQPPRPRPTPKPDPIRHELAEHMRGLIVLCHPDRHANSRLATKITQWLLDVRERLTAAARQ